MVSPFPFHLWLIAFIIFPVSWGWSQNSAASPKTLYDFREVLPVVIKQIETHKGRIGDKMRNTGFLVFHDTLFISPGGTFMLFYWDPNQDTCIRMDSCRYHGSNFGKILFAYHDTIFSAGGYGFWHLHSMITYYDRKNHNWELVLRKGTIADGRFLNMVFIGNALYGFFPESQREYEKSFSAPREPALYRFDLQTKTWEKIKQITGKAFSQMSDFVALAENDRWILSGRLLIDKTSLDGYIIKNPIDLMDNIRESKVFRMAHDTVFGYRFRNGETYLPENLSIQDIIRDSSTIRFSLKPTPLVRKPWFWITLVLFVGGLITVIASIQLRKRRIISQPHEIDHTTALIRQLQEMEHVVLSTEELDQILGIAHLTYDSRKQQRSLILRQVEENEPNLITRERSELDKRTYSYRIRKT
jgi:hypothetical protein